LENKSNKHNRRREKESITDIINILIVIFHLYSSVARKATRQEWGGKNFVFGKKASLAPSNLGYKRRQK
jgi:hypothetical protein